MSNNKIVLVVAALLIGIIACGPVQDIQELGEAAQEAQPTFEAAMPEAALAGPTLEAALTEAGPTLEAAAEEAAEGAAEGSALAGYCDSVDPGALAAALGEGYTQTSNQIIGESAGCAYQNGADVITLTVTNSQQESFAAAAYEAMLASGTPETLGEGPWNEASLIVQNGSRTIAFYKGTYFVIVLGAGEIGSAELTDVARAAANLLP
ncbi:MAG: hypothetical protein ACFB51_07350 [Anaerolineae bacterium]